MRSSDPKALSSTTSVTGGGSGSGAGTTTTATSVPGGTLHAPTPLNPLNPPPPITPATNLTSSPSPSPGLLTPNLPSPSPQYNNPLSPTIEEVEQTLFLDDHTTLSDRQHFIFYQDEGGLQATDEENKENQGTIYYLGVIDILTPYGFVKRAEHYWKVCLLLGGAGASTSTSGSGGGSGGGERKGVRERKKMISQVDPGVYGRRFVRFVGAVVRGGEGGTGFK